MAYGPQKYGIRTPHFMPYEPFLLGVGVVFNLLKDEHKLLLFAHKLLNTPRGPGHRGKILATSEVPSLQNPRELTFDAP